MPLQGDWLPLFQAVDGDLRVGARDQVSVHDLEVYYLSILVEMDSLFVFSVSNVEYAHPPIGVGAVQLALLRCLGDFYELRLSGTAKGQIRLPYLILNLHMLVFK